ncbi:ab-hydrolase associated lipase region containing protein [Anaeramoeba flamelloides]|uniref:Ab-hydrolase associated lipase region containing protein n=1 Tax=Anaeramoeba flamelloides TaxID=1746091 RepID=A0ABQ8XH14_9EUKA|nr:ab-hydrolase associated lipase region containing protein [Anaeramoeba flamelloides]
MIFSIFTFFLRFIGRQVDKCFLILNELILTFISELFAQLQKIVNGVSSLILLLIFRNTFPEDLEKRIQITKNGSKKKKKAHSNILTKPHIGSSFNLFMKGFEELQKHDNMGRKERTSKGNKEKNDPLRKKNPRGKKKYSLKNNHLSVRTESIQSFSPLKTIVSEEELNKVTLGNEQETGLIDDFQAYFHQMSIDILQEFRLFFEDLFTSLSTYDLKTLITQFIFPTRQIKLLKFCTNYLFKFKLSDIVIPQEFSHMTMENLANDFGYPYKEYSVETSDGYILKIDRLPQPESSKVIFLQHGILDSSMGFLARGSDSIVFSLFNSGYDVFLGNFRGSIRVDHTSQTQLNNKKKTKKNFDFSVNEIAFIDIPTMLTEIRKIKNLEMLVKNKKKPASEFVLTTVAHSLGGMATIMHLIWSKYHKRQYLMDNAILLSPTGYMDKKSLHIIWKAGIKFSKVLAKLKLTNLGLPSVKILKVLLTKLTNDFKNSPATRRLLNIIASDLLGGSYSKMGDHPIMSVPDLFYRVGATSMNTVKHLTQCYYSGTFQAFDYGAKKNIKEYGTIKPFNFFSNYHLVEIPVVYVAGMLDTLVSSFDVLKHYQIISKVHPDLAKIRVIEEGHLNFTFGANEDLKNIIITAQKEMEELKLKKNIKIKLDFENINENEIENEIIIDPQNQSSKFDF